MSTSSAHAASMGPVGASRQSGNSQKRWQRVDSGRSFRSACQVAEVRERIWRDWLRGVTERSLSIIYELKREAVEDVVREQARLLAFAARTAGAQIAIVLMVLSGIEAWQSATAVEEGVEVARAFRRSRRSRRRRGLEDGGAEAVEHARMESRAGSAAGESLRRS